MSSAEEGQPTKKPHEGALTIDRAAFLLLRVKRAFKKKKSQRKERSGVGGCASVVPEAKPVCARPAPLLRSRTLPSIVVPGLNILQAQIDAKYKMDAEKSKERDGGVSRWETPRIAFTDVPPVHRHSSPEPPSLIALGVAPPRGYRATGASSTALHRLAKLLNHQKPDNSSARRLSWEKREGSPNRLPRSSSIDSVVEAAWASEPSAPRRLPSPLLCRTDRPMCLVSPIVGRRMKGQRALAG